jgi:hypothetical protein
LILRLRNVRTAGAVSLVLAGALAGSGMASAAGGLPPVGAEVPSSMVALNSAFEFQGSTAAIDFKGGIKQRVEANPSDPHKSVRLRTVGFRVSGELDNGTITFELNDGDPDTESTLRQTQQFPPRYEERNVVSFTATIEVPDQQRIVLESKTPMVLVASLTQYPARGSHYQLMNPVELVDPAHPDTVIARVTKFDAQRGGL